MLVYALNLRLTPTLAVLHLLTPGHVPQVRSAVVEAVSVLVVYGVALGARA